jgi:hypothetical protein
MKREIELLDYFAGLAMQAYISSAEQGAYINESVYAEISYKMAKAMMVEKDNLSSKRAEAIADNHGLNP